mgnify:FL=1
MKVLLAEHAGYCFGVKRAVELAIKTAQDNDNKVYTLGPLIHNNSAVDMLKEKNVFSVDDINKVEGDNIIIRSHGVGKEIYDHCSEKKINLTDATCPFVKKIQKIAYEMYNKGYNIIIIGDKSHPEVQGINGWCDNKAIIGKNLEEFYLIDFNKSEKYAVVVQTTMPQDTFFAVKEYLISLGLTLEFYNTICFATKERQQAVLDLSKKVDAMLIVGGKHSSNTKKLAEIAKKNCDTFLIETAKDIDLEKIKTYDIIGVGAGASTPDFIINEVMDLINEL